MMKANMDGFKFRRTPSENTSEAAVGRQSPFSRVTGGKKVNACAVNLAGLMTASEINDACALFENDHPIGSHGRNRVLYGAVKKFDVLSQVPAFLMSAHMNRMLRNGALGKPMQNTPQMAFSTGLTLMMPITRENVHDILVKGELTIPRDGLEGAFNAFSHGEPSLDRDILGYLAVPARYFLFENGLRFGDKRRTGELVVFPPEGHEADFKVSLHETDLRIVADADDLPVWTDIMVNMSGLKEDLAGLPREHQQDFLLSEVLTDYQRWNSIGNDDRPEISRMFLEDYVTGGKFWCTAYEYESKNIKPEKLKSIDAAQAFFRNNPNRMLYYITDGQENKNTDKGGVQLTVLKAAAPEGEFDKIYPNSRPFAAMAYRDRTKEFGAGQLNSLFDAACFLKQAEIAGAVAEAVTKEGSMMMSVSPSYLNGDDYWYETNRTIKEEFYGRKAVIQHLYPPYYAKRRDELLQLKGLVHEGQLSPTELYHLRSEVDEDFIYRNFEELYPSEQREGGNPRVENPRMMVREALSSGRFKQVAEEAAENGGIHKVSNEANVLDVPNPKDNISISWNQFARLENGRLPENLVLMRDSFEQAAQSLFGRAANLMQPNTEEIPPFFSEAHVGNKLQLDTSPDMRRFTEFWYIKANRLARDAACRHIVESGINRTAELLHGLLHGLTPQTFAMTPLSDMPDLSDVAKMRGDMFGRHLPLPSGKTCRNYSEAKVREFEKRAVYAVQNRYLQDPEHRKEIVEFLDRAYENPSERVNVDHVVPLNSAFVLGFNHIDNYATITSRENFKKGNLYWPGMPTYSREDYINMMYDLCYNGIHEETDLHRIINSVCRWEDPRMQTLLYGGKAPLKGNTLRGEDLALLIEKGPVVLDFLVTGAASVGMLPTPEDKVDFFRRELMSKIRATNMGRHFSCDRMLKIDPEKAAAFWNKVMNIQSMGLRNTLMAVSTMRWHPQFEKFYERLDLSESFSQKMEDFNVRKGDRGHRNGINRFMQHMADYADFEPMVGDKSLVDRLKEEVLSPEMKAVRRAIVEWTKAMTRTEMAEQVLRMEGGSFREELVLNRAELESRIRELGLVASDFSAAQRKIDARAFRRSGNYDYRPRGQDNAATDVRGGQMDNSSSNEGPGI